MAAMEACVTIDTQAIARALMAQMAENRLCRMIFMHGEACSKTTAAKVISCSYQTIDAMVKDGRIRTACEGNRIDVQSLYEYIENRKEMDRKARMVRRHQEVYV